MDLDLEKLAGQIGLLARRAGQIMLDAGAEKDVHMKTSPGDLVTKYDAMVQAFLQRELLALVPEAGFFGEEDCTDRTEGRDGWQFVVDPIDGTMNFVKNSRRSCTSIALVQNGRPRLAVVYDPYREELFTAWSGGGAYCNGQQLAVREEPANRLIVNVGTTPYNADYHKQTIRLAGLLLDVCMDLRRSGSAVLDLCDIAMNRAGVMYEYQLAPWDYAAGSLIVREAGGLATDFDGRALPCDRRSSVAAGTKLGHETLLALYRRIKEEKP